MSSSRIVRLLPLLCLTFSIACRKGGSSGGGTPAPAITPVGTPMGIPVTKTIGLAGGTIVSADGRVELNFPAGVLPNVAITIQPVAGEAPGGVGLGYHFMPDGLTFNSPATVTFHYIAGDLNGSLPYLFYIAFQDSANAWMADIKNRKVDTVAHTVSLPISHFSIWELGDRLRIVVDPAKDTLHENEKRALQVVNVIPQGQDAGDELSTLSTVEKLPDNSVTSWKIVGGGGFTGTIAGSGNSATYSAPPAIIASTDVPIEADLNYSLVAGDGNGNIISVNKILLFRTLTLESSSLSFMISIKYEAFGTAGSTISGQIDDYTDIASFQVTVDGDTVKGFAFKNQAPSVVPTQGLGPDGTTVIQAELDSIGEVNIVGLTGTVEDVGKIKVVQLMFDQPGCSTPKWVWIENGLTIPFGGSPVVGYPSGMSFVLRDSSQTQAQGNIKITPID